MAPIRIGTDCSGMEAPIQAIRNLKVNYAHKFSCDINENARATIQANFPHGLMYEDLTKRDNKSAPDVDIYIAGFPCQPFSMAGMQQGFKDKKGRGKIFFHVLNFIAAKRPRVFILENVSGLKSINGGKYLKAIMKSLENLKSYNLYSDILNTKEHGVPHSRRRWYCIGIDKSYDAGTFSFPKPIKCPPMRLFLERKKKVADEGLPPRSQSVARSNVLHSLRALKREGSDPLQDPFIVDCDSSKNRMTWCEGVSPCITVGRGAGHWVTNRHRRLTKEEMMRLQGMNPTTFTLAVSENQLGKQLGNTMSVNVLERIFVSLLPAAKLCKKTDVKDRWASGVAVRQLQKTRGRGFKAMSAKAKKAMQNAKSREGSPPRSLKRSSSSASSPGKRLRRA